MSGKQCGRRIPARRVERSLNQEVRWGDPRLEICSSIYIWLAYPADWHRGIVAAAMLGGASSSRCAIYSALASLATEGACLPTELVKRHRWTPVTIQWIDLFISRLLQWPHGENDLVAAHGMRSPVLVLGVVHQLLGARLILRQILNFSSSLFRRK